MPPVDAAKSGGPLIRVGAASPSSAQAGIGLRDRDLISLTQDKPCHQWHREGVAAMAVLVDQSCVHQRLQHLIHVAATEGLF